MLVRNVTNIFRTGLTNLNTKVIFRRYAICNGINRTKCRTNTSKYEQIRFAKIYSGGNSWSGTRLENGMLFVCLLVFIGTGINWPILARYFGMKITIKDSPQLPEISDEELSLIGSLKELVDVNRKVYYNFDAGVKLHDRDK